MEDKIVCLNCGNEFTGKFCPECGQNSKVKRISWKELASSITRGILNTDSGFLFTIFRLFYTPYLVLKGYVEGKRKKFFAPFTMMFIIIALYALLKELFNGIHKTQVSEELVANSNIEINLPSWLQLAVDFLGEHIGLIMLFAMPFLVLALRICFGSKFRSSYNTAEVFTMTGYMNAQLFLIMSLFTIVTLFFPKAVNSENLVLFISFIALLSWDMVSISGYKIAKNIWRALLCYLLFFALIILTIIVIVLLVALILQVFGVINVGVHSPV